MDQPCDTYTVWSPTQGTVTARCHACGPIGPTYSATTAGVAQASQDEMNHLLEALARLQEDPDASTPE